MNENWLNDAIIDYKPPSNLVELIENNLDFEELEEFEGRRDGNWGMDESR